ncbi:MAG: LysE/ArgO family amino acid transporter [Sphingomonadales bacterium]|jgi:L-lysine exporter family protein LysE/ArgO
MVDHQIIDFINGLLISLGLIVAIGPQNAYVLRKGLKGRDVFAVATTCFLADALLIALAIGGVGAILTANPTFSSIAAWGGALFLLWFGFKSFKEAHNPRVLTEGDMADVGSGARGKGTGAVIMMALMLTFLNPHAYFDTFVVIGGIAAQYEGADRTIFGAGAILGSFIWFFGIGYGAKLIAPAFRKPKAWMILDSFIGFIMWGLAIALIWGELTDSFLLH